MILHLWHCGQTHWLVIMGINLNSYGKDSRISKSTLPVHMSTWKLTMHNSLFSHAFNFEVQVWKQEIETFPMKLSWCKNYNKDKRYIKFSWNFTICHLCNRNFKNKWLSSFFYFDEINVLNNFLCGEMKNKFTPTNWKLKKSQTPKIILHIFPFMNEGS